MLDECRLICCTGYFLSRNLETMLRIAKYANTHSVPFVLSLGAVYVIETKRNHVD